MFPCSWCLLKPFNNVTNARYFLVGFSGIFLIIFITYTILSPLFSSRCFPCNPPYFIWCKVWYFYIVIWIFILNWLQFKFIDVIFVLIVFLSFVFIDDGNNSLRPISIIVYYFDCFLLIFFPKLS